MSDTAWASLMRTLIWFALLILLALLFAFSRIEDKRLDDLESRMTTVETIRIEAPRDDF